MTHSLSFQIFEDKWAITDVDFTAPFHSPNNTAPRSGCKESRIASKFKTEIVQFKKLKSADDLKVKLTSALVGEMGAEQSNWTEEILKALPGAALKGVEGLAKKYLGDGASDIMKSLHLKLDPLRLFPNGTVVCFDDLERSKVDVEEVLGVVNFLLEHKSARVLIIANEDYLSGENAPDEEKRNTYKKFKEKVIWQTLGFYVPFGEVFDSFVEEFAATKHVKIKGAKHLILDTLKAGDCKNLRTLQKVIRVFDDVLAIDGIQLEERNLRFLIALIDEDSRDGLNADASIYNKTYSPTIEQRRNRKPEDLKPDEKVGRNFYLRYFKDQFSIGFSEALHGYVRTGILDETMLRNEIALDQHHSLQENKPKLQSS